MIQIDMEMPDSCRECWFLKYDMYSGETSCMIEDMILARYFKALDFEGRHEECPLIEVPNMNVGDMINRQAAIEIVNRYDKSHMVLKQRPMLGAASIVIELEELPSAQPEQRYTKEELSVFKHGISLSLLSKRSAQHWHYDEDTATEIKFLERLYEKVGADMRGEQDETD